MASTCRHMCVHGLAGHEHAQPHHMCVYAGACACACARVCEAPSAHVPSEHANLYINVHPNTRVCCFCAQPEMLGQCQPSLVAYEGWAQRLRPRVLHTGVTQRGCGSGLRTACMGATWAVCSANLQQLPAPHPPCSRYTHGCQLHARRRRPGAAAQPGQQAIHLAEGTRVWKALGTEMMPPRQG